MRNLKIDLQSRQEFIPIRSADTADVYRLQTRYCLQTLLERARAKLRLGHITRQRHDDLVACVWTASQQFCQPAPSQFISGPMQIGAQKKEVDARIKSRASGLV